MIAFINNRPVLQIGPYQVIDYDTAWLDDALRRAAVAADHENFPFIEEIRCGIVLYLETKCPLRLLQLDDLFARLRKMLVKIGCQPIAEKLVPLAPPVTVSLVRAAMDAGNGFELAFFETLRSALADLRSAGAEEIRFVGLRQCVLLLRGTQQWNKGCESLLQEIQASIAAWDHDQAAVSRPLRLLLDA
ncbi:MAG: hypothetical protein NTW21_34320 [Verrucomicrobia bacterium]|nr:hypothetical protein [Verrucomicrobiota bacterium]